MDKLLVITGPTATGKTALAVRLAKEFDGELISADSRQVYRGMDIGTGKDRSSIDVAVWMIDIVDPKDEFSVSNWVILSRKIIQDIHNRKKLPIVVGGTGFYISALLYPPETLYTKPNMQLRKMLAVKNLHELQVEIQEKLPEVWERMNNSDRKNPRRIIRKIEIGKLPLKKHEKLFDAFICGLCMPFPDLYEKIDHRVDERVNEGVLDEIRTLLKNGVNFDMPSMASLGYRQWKEWFGNKTDENMRTALQKWKFDEHAYARRQMTYLKKLQGIRWYHPQNDFEQLRKDAGRWYTIGSI